MIFQTLNLQNHQNLTCNCKILVHMLRGSSVHKIKNLLTFVFDLNSKVLGFPALKRRLRPRVINCKENFPRANYYLNFWSNENTFLSECFIILRFASTKPLSTANHRSNSIYNSNMTTLEDKEIFQNAEEGLDAEVLRMSNDELLRRTRLLDNEIKIMRSDIMRVSHEQQAMKDKIKENTAKIKVNKTLPYLVSNVVEILDVDPQDQEEIDGANVDLDSQRKGTIFLYLIHTYYYPNLIADHVFLASMIIHSMIIMSS